MAWKKPELLPPWLQRWGGGTLIFGAVAVILLLFVVLMFMDSRTANESARPARASSVPRNQGSASSNSAAVSASGALEPVTFLDAPNRGNIDSATGDVASVRTRYEEALEKKPADPELLNSLGLTLERLGQTDAAIARFERATQIDSQKWAYHFNLAHAASERQDWDRAISEYRTAAGLLPGDYPTQYNLAMALHRKGDEVAAIPEFQRGIEMAPSVPTFHLALAVSLEKAGRTGEAEREYQTYLEMAPSAPNASGVRSHLQSLGGRPRS